MSEERQKAETTIRELAEARKISKLPPLILPDDRKADDQTPNSELIWKIPANKPNVNKNNVKTT